MAKTIPLPGTWKDAFVRQSMRTAFELRLSQPMMEFLCATAEDCHWDRVRYPGGSRPDNFITISTALQKRGLIQRKPDSQIEREKSERDKDVNAGRIDFWDGPAYYHPTPAGLALVELFKVVGIFIESESAMNRRKRNRS